MVAQQLATSRPGRIAKLVLAETAFSTQSSLWERVQTWIAISFMKVIPQSMLVTLSARQYGRIHPGVALFIKQEMGRYDRETAIRVMRAALDFDGKRLLGNIMSPTLVLVGEKNRQTHSQAREMARRILNAHFVIIPAAHHLLNIDNPEAFNRAVLEFLTSR
ncbi:MAG: alpha/beta hydrolase [Roseiflexus sp.]|jgi:3-oxoadipate enol-lactonase|nr:alpha/beta hydrolase [Roseiflexus sp.]MBO9384649.1 alpha/beta hydrolase [Roseiflexus sp.]MBO9388602.1 alpha/beta hydrolase [Roseiflexus sp.]